MSSVCAVNLPTGKVLEKQVVILMNIFVAFRNQRTVRLHFINGEPGLSIPGYDFFLSLVPFLPSPPQIIYIL